MSLLYDFLSKTSYEILIFVPTNAPSPKKSSMKVLTKNKKKAFGTLGYNLDKNDMYIIDPN